MLLCIKDLNNYTILDEYKKINPVRKDKIDIDITLIIE